MIDLTRITPEALLVEPYKWAFIDRLFSPADADALVKTFPRDHYKTVKGYDGEKGYQYEARALVGMGAESLSAGEYLSPAWRQLGEDLLSPAYRAAMSRLTGLDLISLPMEVNVFHYGQSAWLGPHSDLEDKVATHVFYFNEKWNMDDGGCLTILRAPDMKEAVRTIPPLIGNSSVVVRSANSWHAVSRVRAGCRISRRSMTVTFYRPGSPSTMWPTGDTAPLHDYMGEPSLFRRLLRRARRRIRN
jgi:SM-20-related protein